MATDDNIDWKDYEALDEIARTDEVVKRIAADLRALTTAQRNAVGRLVRQHGCGALIDEEGLCPYCHDTPESREYMRSISS